MAQKAAALIVSAVIRLCQPRFVRQPPDYGGFAQGYGGQAALRLQLAFKMDTRAAATLRETIARQAEQES